MNTNGTYTPGSMQPYNPSTSDTLTLIEYGLANGDGYSNLTVENACSNTFRVGAEATRLGLFLGITRSTTSTQIVKIRCPKHGGY